ncbi:MAG: hypothetical protein RLY71_2211 [Pseudomonadota bacterium]|jgi:hypothetical protein
MSEPRIALVAEGPTDRIVIEAALKAILKRPFVLNVLQPEPTNPRTINGWGGVFKWCQQFRQRGAASIEADGTLSDFDLVIVHLDADVADKSYADLGAAVAQGTAHLQPLPCARPCPSPGDTVAALEAVLLDWLGLTPPVDGTRSLFCIPSKASESWLAAAVLPTGDALLTSLECRADLETRLAVLPRAQRIRKGQRDYQTHASQITSRWSDVTARCQQAASFTLQVSAVARTFPPA